MKRIVIAFFLVFAVLASTASAQNDTTICLYAEKGWNQLGNSLATPIALKDLIGSKENPVTGVTENVKSVWIWVAGQYQWGFHSPSLSAEENELYASAMGYMPIMEIKAGAGFWLKSSGNDSINFGCFYGKKYDMVAGYDTLPDGWNMLAVTEYLDDPSELNAMLASTPPVPESYMQGMPSFSTLWSWGNESWHSWGSWYFYSPELERNGGAKLVAEYAEAKGYKDFVTNQKKLYPGNAVWVNKTSRGGGGRG